MVNEPSVNASKRIVIRDSTLREGLDTPNVAFTIAQKIKIARLLDKANVPEIEIVAPGKVLRDLEFARRLKEEKLRITTSGLVYAYNPQCRHEIESAGRYLDRFDVLMPVSAKRKPYGREDKIECLRDVLAYALEFQPEVGVGFPHSYTDGGRPAVGNSCSSRQERCQKSHSFMIPMAVPTRLKYIV